MSRAVPPRVRVRVRVRVRGKACLLNEIEHAPHRRGGAGRGGAGRTQPCPRRSGATKWYP